MRIPNADLQHWGVRLQSEPVSLVLREIAQHYRLGKSDLGLTLPQLCHHVCARHVQAVWIWDLENKGEGLTDQALEAALSELTCG